MLKLKEDLLREAIKIDTPVKSQIASDWYTVEKFPGGNEILLVYSFFQLEFCLLHLKVVAFINIVILLFDPLFIPKFEICSFSGKGHYYKMAQIWKWPENWFLRHRRHKLKWAPCTWVASASERGLTLVRTPPRMYMH